jgi:very-short-patch-repair endonuclease
MATHQNPKTNRARKLRQTANAGEQALWSAVKNRNLGGWKFTRQYPIGPYFADFVCRERGVVIEVDGSQHVEQDTYDRARDEYMIAAGYSVYRVPTVNVLQDLGAVCDSLLAVLDDRIEDFVEASDLRFTRSFNANMRRGLTSRHALRINPR